MSTSIFRRRTFLPALIAVLFVAAILAAQHLRGPVHYPHVAIEAQGGVRLEFLREGVREIEDCRAAAASVAEAIRASCPSCRVAAQECLERLDPDQERLLSEQPIAVPSSRLPNGVIAYLSRDPALALAACRETERLSMQSGGVRVACFAPEAERPFSAASPAPPNLNPRQRVIGLLAFALAGFVCAFACYLLVRHEALHARWSHDRVEAGPQKFHAVPTPRIGGVGLMIGLLVAGAALPAMERGGPGELFGYLLFASLPAFLGGITEDVTKRVSVPARLALTMLAAAAGAWLLGAIIPRLDVPGFDALLRWTPFAVAFTIFAAGGVANAINIIDGYNGLAAGHAVIVLAALAFVSARVGDSFLFAAALAMIGALLGFFVWNYPRGKIFLGDGGAYLLGFWMAELSVLLVARHPEVSPWFPMLLLVFPIWETLFSMYRRKIVLGLSPGQPDRFHMHQVLYAYLHRKTAATDDPARMTRRNSRVAPYCWLMSLCSAVPALFFWKSTVGLVIAALVFCAAYVLLYRALSKDLGGQRTAA
ncbi:MAG: glycosyltransferase [Burkholderiales bacterium]